SQVYATTDSADEAIAAIRTLPEPWFVWLAFNAPHKPVHEPPAHLHTYAPPLVGIPTLYRAMVEAMDTEMGRVLAEIGPEDTVIFLGDNGPYEEAITAPQDPTHGKGTIFEGGSACP
ncbi:MAG: N-acetylgalactosamine 6-sulfatase (GALNS), partial [Planctomycetota bacterium]